MLSARPPGKYWDPYAGLVGECLQCPRNSYKSNNGDDLSCIPTTGYWVTAGVGAAEKGQYSKKLQITLSLF